MSSIPTKQIHYLVPWPQTQKGRYIPRLFFGYIGLGLPVS